LCGGTGVGSGLDRLKSSVSGSEWKAADYGASDLQDRSLVLMSKLAESYWEFIPKSWCSID